MTAVIRGSAHSGDFIGLRGGGTFLMTLQVSKADSADLRAFQNVVDAIVRVGTLTAETSPDVAGGVAFYPRDADTANDLLRFASIAAIRARYTGSGAVVAFHPGMNALLLRDHLFQKEIGKALLRGGVSTVFQPKVDLVSGAMLGAEILIRWTHPDWGPVPPSEFIPAVERDPVIHDLFDFTLRSALMAARTWRAFPDAPRFVSVNASVANLRMGNFVRRVQKLMAEINIAPIQLELEITESLLLDDQALFASRLRALKEIGVRIAIDDFGTRFTGFDLLCKMPLDTMKIDRCFIHGIHHSPDMRAVRHHSGRGPSTESPHRRQRH